MNDVTKNKINGIGIFLRFLTPLMVGFLLMLATDIRQSIKDVQEKLDNHIEHEVREIFERMSSMEATQKMILREIRDR